MADIPKPYGLSSRAHPSAGMQAEKSAPLEYSPSGTEGRAQQDLALAQQDYPDATMYQVPGDTEYIYGFRTLPDGTVEDLVLDKAGKRLNLAANPAALEAVRKQRLRQHPESDMPSPAVMDPQYRDVTLKSGETLEGARVTSTPEGLLTATGDAPARTIPYEELGTQDEPWTQAVPGGDVDPGLEAFDRFAPLGADSPPDEFRIARHRAAAAALHDPATRDQRMAQRLGIRLRGPLSRSQLEDVRPVPARSRRLSTEDLEAKVYGDEPGDIRRSQVAVGQRGMITQMGEDALMKRHRGRMEEAKAERKGRSSKKES